MSAGVLLLRAQPVHLGHMDVVRQALIDNDKVLIFIGSANKSGTVRNPIHIDLRVEMVIDTLKELGLYDENRIMVFPLNDWSMEDAYQYAKEWGNFFYYNAVNQIETKKFTFYYNDDKNTVINWFNEDLAERITIKNAVRVREVSATKVREAILNDDTDYLKEMCGESVVKRAAQLKKILLSCDKEDFIMN